MENEDEQCLDSKRTLILACSGGSNVGQAANNVMIELDRIGIGEAFCLAGIGAGFAGFVENAKTAETIVIDGCPVGCAKKAFEEHGLTPSRYFVVTEAGIEKKHGFDTLESDTEEMLGHVRSIL